MHCNVNDGNLITKYRNQNWIGESSRSLTFQLKCQKYYFLKFITLTLQQNARVTAINKPLYCPLTTQLQGSN